MYSQSRQRPAVSQTEAGQRSDSLTGNEPAATGARLRPVFGGAPPGRPRPTSRPMRRPTSTTEVGCCARPAASRAERTPGWNHTYSPRASSAATNGHDCVALVRVHGQERDAREERGERPEDRDRASRSVTEPHEAVVQVPRVGDAPLLPRQQPPAEREDRVDDRDAQDDERDQQGREEEVRAAGEREVGASADRDRRYREQESEERAHRRHP